MPGGVVEELAEWKLRGASELADWKRGIRGGQPVFLSAHAGRVRRQSAANVARRLKTAIRRANRRLAELGIEPISERVTPHSLRRTYASLRAAAGEDPVYIAEQLGHTDPRFTLSVYTKAVKRRVKLVRGLPRGVRAGACVGGSAERRKGSKGQMSRTSPIGAAAVPGYRRIWLS